MFSNNIPATLSCILFVFLFVLASYAGLELFNLWYNKQKQPQNNEVAGLIFGALSLIYSLILAFVIVAVWENYDELNKTVEQEGDKLNSILAHSLTLPDTLKQPLTKAISTYCDQVVNKEWKMQETEENLHPSAIPSLRLMLLRLQPQNALQQSLYNVIDDDLSTISDLRRARLSHTQSHVPPLVWLILRAGSFMMIIFSYFLNTHKYLKRIYLFFLCSLIGMCLFLVNTLDQPFNGSAKVSKKPYENILLELKERSSYAHN